MLIAGCSDKGSPGVTTTAMALASAWPTPMVVVEADPGGGDLAIRLRTRDRAALPESPTVLTVAAAARTSPSADLVSRYAHVFTKGVSVVPGQLSAEQGAGVTDWVALGAALCASEVPVVVDLGRLHGASGLMAVAAAADVVVVVGRAASGSVIRLRERLNRLAPELSALRGSPPRLFPVLVSTARYGNADVADLEQILTGSPSRPFVAGAGFVAFDPGSVARLEAGEEPEGRLARTSLLRTAREVVGQLEELVDWATAAARDGAVTSAAGPGLGNAT